MPADRFDLDALLERIAGIDPPSRAQHTLVKTLMEIDYLPSLPGKIGQLDARIAGLQALEAATHARLVGHPDLKGAPPPPAPPPSVAREFALLMAVRSALEKLGATRAALARRLG